jgi:hypothetical protein
MQNWVYGAYPHHFFAIVCFYAPLPLFIGRKISEKEPAQLDEPRSLKYFTVTSALFG